MRALLGLVFSLLGASAGLAADGQWLILNGKSLDFFSLDPADYGAEGLSFRMQCSGAVTGQAGVPMFVVSDQRNVGAIKALLDVPQGLPAAEFITENGAIPAKVWSYGLVFNELNVQWDMSLSLDFNLSRLAELAASGSVSLVVGGQTFDLTPRSEDRVKLADFAEQC